MSRLEIELKYAARQFFNTRDMGIHNQAKELARRELAAAELGGSWLIQPKQHVRQKSAQTFSLRRVEGAAIIVRVKPGDNGSAWEYCLIPPHGTLVDVAYERLARGRATEEADDESSTPAEPAPEANGKPADFFSKLEQLRSAATRFQELQNDLQSATKERDEARVLLKELEERVIELELEIEADKVGREAIQLIESMKRLLA